MYGTIVCLVICLCLGKIYISDTICLFGNFLFLENIQYHYLFGNFLFGGNIFDIICLFGNFLFPRNISDTIAANIFQAWMPQHKSCHCFAISSPHLLQNISKIYILEYTHHSLKINPNEIRYISSECWEYICPSILNDEWCVAGNCVLIDGVIKLSAQSIRTILIMDIWPWKVIYSGVDKKDKICSIASSAFCLALGWVWVQLLLLKLVLIAKQTKAAEKSFVHAPVPSRIIGQFGTKTI